MEIKENIPLAPLTTFHIGGPASHFVAVQAVEELKQACKFAKENALKTLVLGGGSNVLMPDAGFDGLVIKIEIKGLGLDESDDRHIVVAAAGESWDSMVEYSIQHDLWGVENLSGIPGTVGGAVSGNIGAYGQALSQTLLWAEAFDTQDLSAQKFGNEACAFDYRESFFKHTERYIIIRAAFALRRLAQPELSYKDLALRFNGASPSLEEIRSAVLEIRAGKFPDLALEGTAGSFFKNPIVSDAEASNLKELYPEMPLFDMPETAGVKIPLAWLLDKVLHMRGFSIGSARLFEKQPLVIVAQKSSSSDDVQKLSEKVERDVKEKIGIEIEREVKII